MHKAEQLAWEAGYTKMAVIAGVGSRGFYRKLGYEEHGEGDGDGGGGFMMRDIDASVMTRGQKTTFTWSCSTLVMVVSAVSVGLLAIAAQHLQL